MADKKSKVGGARASPRRTAEAEKDTRPQRERFIEAAKAAGVTDDGFDKALSKVAPSKNRGPK